MSQQSKVLSLARRRGGAPRVASVDADSVVSRGLLLERVVGPSTSAAWHLYPRGFPPPGSSESTRAAFVNVDGGQCACRAEHHASARWGGGPVVEQPFGNRAEAYEFVVRTGEHPVGGFRFSVSAKVLGHTLDTGAEHGATVRRPVRRRGIAPAAQSAETIPDDSDLPSSTPQHLRCCDVGWNPPTTSQASTATPSPT